MHRLASTSQASNEFFINLSPAGLKLADIDKLPMYDINKKEMKTSGENFVHLIPLVLILCALCLWIFSHPVHLTKGGSLAAGIIEGLSIHGGGNQIGA